MNRLEQMKKYLAEAELDPENNKLYIEDLKLSIKEFYSIFGKPVVVGSGFVANDEHSQ